MTKIVCGWLAQQVLRVDHLSDNDRATCGIYAVTAWQPSGKVRVWLYGILEYVCMPQVVLVRMQ